MEHQMNNPIMLTDCLHNCDRVCVSTFENSTIAEGTPGQVYGRGIINGATAGIMAVTGCSYLEATRKLIECRSSATDFDNECVPEAFRPEWNKQ